MRKTISFQKLLSAILCLLFSCNSVFALNAATDLIDHTSGVNPVTNGNVTNITTTHNIDTYHWSSFNLAGNETANFIFGANGQTALNYLSPGANPSAIYGSIISSGASGNILLFNPNGIMMGGGASVSGANTFFASTNRFDGIVNGKVAFSEAEKNNPLSVGNIQFNNVNNAHFVAPNVIFKADNLKTANSASFRAIGGGEYDASTNIFSNEIGTKSPMANTNILDVNANITSNKITIEAKTDSNTYATALISGDIKANKAVTGENGEIYIVAANDNNSSTAGMQFFQNATIGGESAKVDINAENLVQNGDINVSGSTGGGSINIVASDTIKQKGVLKANCTGENGNGGNINILAKKTADISGIIEAKKGSISGSGGNVEISTLGKLILKATVNTTGGMLTIDPINLVIAPTPGPDPDTTYMTSGDVENLLATTPTTLYADRDLTVDSALSWTSGNSLTLDAGRSIAINSNITTNGALLSLIANDVDNPLNINIANRGGGLGGITTADGVTISTGLGNVSFLTKETGITYLADNTVIGSDINTNNLTITNSGLSKNIMITGDIIATGLAKFTAKDITIENTAYSYGGFDLEARGSVKTGDLITVDSTHSGADITINANQGTLDNTSIKTGKLNAGSATGVVYVSLANTDNNLNGSITTGDIIAGDDVGVNGIEVQNDNSSLTSGIFINSLTAPSSVALWGGNCHNVVLNEASSADYGLVIYSGGSVSTDDIKVTQPINNAVVIMANMNTFPGVDVSVVTGDITATLGGVFVAILDSVNVGNISVGTVNAGGITIKNQDKSIGSNLTLLGNLTSSGVIELWSNDTINVSNSTLTADSVGFSSKVIGNTLNIVADNFDMALTEKGNITNFGLQEYTPTKNITNSQISYLFDYINITNLNLGSEAQVGAIGETATAVDFGNTVVSARTQGNVYLKALNDLKIGTIATNGEANLFGQNISIAKTSTAYGGFAIEAGGSVTTDGLITADLTHTGSDITIKANQGSIAGTSINVGNIKAGVGDVTLTLPTVASSGDITLHDINANKITVDPFNLIIDGAITTPGASSFDATNNIDITATGSVTTGGNSTFTAGNDITNNGSIVGTSTSSDIALVAGNDDNINGTISTGGGTLTINGGHDININNSITTNGGDVIMIGNDSSTPSSLGNIKMTSLGSIDAGSGYVGLALQSTIFSGDITMNNIKAGSIEIKNEGIPVASTSDIFINGLLTVAGDAILKATGDVTQDSGSGGITIGGTTELKSGSSNNITLEKILNDFVGAITIAGGNNASLGDANDLNFDTSAVSGALTAVAIQDINVKGELTANNGIGLDAGRNVDIKANITAIGDNVVIIANNEAHSGTSANVTMASGKTISAKNGNVDISLVDNKDAGKITLDNIIAKTILVLNESKEVGTDVIINDGGVLTATGKTANPLVLSSAGGNFINKSGAGALSAVDDRWLVYTGSPADTTLKGLAPANTLYSSTYKTVPPSTVTAGNSVLYRTPDPNNGGGSGSGSSGGGAIVGGTVGGIVAAGAAGGYYGLGLLPGLLLGLASPIQLDESMLDVIDKSRNEYPLLVRNIQYSYQTDDISKLDPDKVGSAKFIPDNSINNGSYDLIKIKIPPKFANAPKGVTVKITQKSGPFGISKDAPDMNFNAFSTLGDKQIESMYQTRRFLKPNYLSKRIAMIQNSKIEANNGIIQKTIVIQPNEIKNNLSIAVSYLKNGQFPRKNSNLKFDKQAYSLVVQFIENK